MNDSQMPPDWRYGDERPRATGTWIFLMTTLIGIGLLAYYAIPRLAIMPSDVVFDVDVPMIIPNGGATTTTATTTGAVEGAATTTDDEPESEE